MHKTEKLQELERQANDVLIDLCYGDESNICTEGYVPYGWQFPDENVYIPSQRVYQLNIFGMIDPNTRYEGFTATESITAEKLTDFLDRLSFKIKKDTFVVLDNASSIAENSLPNSDPYGRNEDCSSLSCLHIVRI